MAEVQLALQRGPAGFEKLVVVKLVHNNLASQKAFVDMLLDEARVAALVKHPNVVDIYDLGQADGRYFIAMEYLEGEPLLAVLRAGREGKRLDVLSTGRLIADTAEGLDAAHELRSMSGDRLELVHHDISLGNIVVLYNGQVKLVDFGVAKATQTAVGPKSKVQGKFSYMAPEKLKGAPGDRRSDIFSLGCVMWEALTLKRLFRGGNDAETMKQVLENVIQPPSRVNSEVPPEYDAIVMRALERDPNKRQRTAKEMAVEIEELLRKRGYGAKNDKIARYMQDTFKTHIDARKKLVQEVVAKGSASAEILDAAFSTDSEMAAGSPVQRPSSSDVAVRAKPFGLPRPGRDLANEAVPVATPAWADSSPRTRVSPPPGAHPMFDGGKHTTTEIEPLRDVDDADSEATSIAKPLDRAKMLATNVGSRAKDLAASVATRAKAILADPRKRLYVFGAGGAVVLLLLVILLVGGDDKPPAAAAPKPDRDIAVTDTGSAKAVVDEPAANDTDQGDAVDIEIETPEVVARPDPVEPKVETKIDDTPKGDKAPKLDKPKVDRTPKLDKPKVDRPPPAPGVDVVDIVNQGVKAFVTGDSRGALALLNKAKAAKPGYAPTYRVLGKVHKKLGDVASAKAAYQRYLKLAPNASDAAQIRKELDTL
jgi:serine/threonine protein kinase